MMIVKIVCAMMYIMFVSSRSTTSPLFISSLSSTYSLYQNRTPRQYSPGSAPATPSSFCGGSCADMKNENKQKAPGGENSWQQYNRRRHSSGGAAQRRAVNALDGDGA